MRYPFFTSLAMIGAICCGSLVTPAAEAPVSRAEYEQVLRRLDELEQRSAATGQAAADKPSGLAEILSRLETSLRLTGVVQGTHGMDDEGSAEGDVTDGSLRLDLDLATALGAHGRAYVAWRAGYGPGLDEIVATAALNNTAADDGNVRLVEAWYEHWLWADRVLWRVGKLDLAGSCGARDSAFDGNAAANDECCQFLNGTFVNNVAVEWPADNSCGALLWAFPHERLELGLGAAEADADWENVLDQPFAIVQAGLNLQLGGQQGHLRVYGWLNARHHTEILDPLADRERNAGWGVSLDQQLPGGLVAFGRYGAQNETVAVVGHAWSAGVQWSPRYLGEAHVIGLAYGYTATGDDQRRLDRLAGRPSEQEEVVELYYRIGLGDHFALSPDVQWIRKPAGDPAADDIWTFGLRGSLSF